MQFDLLEEVLGSAKPTYNQDVLPRKKKKSLSTI
jgi:hypothetical protein